MAGFLKVKSAEEVLKIIETFQPLEAETIPLEAACGRILAAPLTAPQPVPHFARSTMDGYAVRAADTFGASESLPAFLEIAGEVSMGKGTSLQVKRGKAVAVPTGGMLPAGADAVVMIEYAHPLDEITIEVSKPVAPGDHVLTVGEDIAENREVFPAGHRLRPQDLGVLAALGITDLSVHCRPRVAVLSTGDEIVPVSTSTVPPGKIRDINTFTLSGQIQMAGGLVGLRKIVSDDPDALTEVCREALKDHDVVMLSGGSSVGVRDYTVQIPERFPESELLVQGIAIRPGKPTILARIGKKTFWGLPGHPASAMMVFTAFVRPFLDRLGGQCEAPKIVVNLCKAVLTQKLPSVHGRADYIPVVLSSTEGTLRATPLFGKSAMISVLARADGYVIVPEHVEGLDEKAEVTVYLFSHY